MTRNAIPGKREGFKASGDACPAEPVLAGNTSALRARAAEIHHDLWMHALLNLVFVQRDDHAYG